MFARRLKRPLLSKKLLLVYHASDSAAERGQFEFHLIPIINGSAYPLPYNSSFDATTPISVCVVCASRVDVRATIKARHCGIMENEATYGLQRAGRNERRVYKRSNNAPVERSVPPVPKSQRLEINMRITRTSLFPWRV